MTTLTKGRVHNSSEALVYMTECTLATVDMLSDKSRPPKHELERQIDLAQSAIDWIRMFRLQDLAERSPSVWSVLNHHHGCVAAWAKRGGAE
jgi:hypothetical protein